MNNPYAEKPWLKFYDEHVKENLDFKDRHFHEIFKEIVDKFPNRAAVIYMGNKITFKELDSCSNKFAQFLKKQGIKPGETVGVNLPNVPAYYIAIIGIVKAGCVLTGVSPLLQPKELEYQLNDSESKVLITLDILFEKAEGIITKTGVKTIVYTEIADFLPSLKKFLGKLLKKIPSGEVKDIEGIHVESFINVLSRMKGKRVDEKVGLSAPMLMQYTGGTTGPPKGAVLTHKNMIYQLQQFTTWIDISTGESVLCSAFPLFHMAGLALSLIYMMVGATQVAIPNPRDLDFIISAIDKYKPDCIVNVPTIFLELLNRASSIC